MSNTDMQTAIIDSINILVEDKINKLNYVKFRQGVVLSVDGYSCIVRIAETDFECKLMEHLHSWIEPQDVVNVEVGGNGTELFVSGKIGTTKTNSFVVEDATTSNYVSGIEGVEDENSVILKPDLILE